jgi:protein TonB
MAENRVPQDLVTYDHPFDPDPGGAALFRLGLVAAVIAHATVFAITWPSLVHDEVVPVPEIRVLPFQIVKFLPPPPIEDRVTLPPRRIPIPDPDPFGPEPIREEKQWVIDRPVPVDFVPNVPLPPPIPLEEEGPGVVEAGVDIDPPVILHRVEPRYTDAALKIRFQGAVVLSLLIDTDGRVADVSVLDPQPFGLTESAVTAVQQWRFQPCTFDGRPVSVRYTLTVRFKTTR